LQKIKDQELACVEEETPESPPEETTKNTQEDQQNSKEEITPTKKEPKPPTISESIKLSPKDIKTENNNEKLYKNKY